MSWMAHIVVFVVAWWLVLFLLLPLGVRTHEESGLERPEGTAESAPVKAHMTRKMLGALVGAVVIWGIFYFIATHDLISLR